MSFASCAIESPLKSVKEYLLVLHLSININVTLRVADTRAATWRIRLYLLQVGLSSKYSSLQERCPVAHTF